MDFILAIVFWLICGGLAGYLASQKNRSVGVWFTVGLLLGPLGLIVAAGVPKVDAAERHDEPVPQPENFGNRGGIEDLQSSIMNRK